MAETLEKFAKANGEALQMPIVLVDERLFRAKAELLLQSYLQSTRVS